jgi:hypothetical protein
VDVYAGVSVSCSSPSLYAFFFWRGILTERYSRIYLCAIAFSTIAVIAAFFVQDISHMMTDNVAVTLQNDGQARKEEKTKSQYV